MNLREKIANFGLFFVKNFRLSLIIFFACVILGTLSYTTFLKREGFPSISVPIAFVQTSYFVNDINKVDTEVTKKLESVAKEIPEINKITSQTTENFSFVTVQFEEGTSSKEGIKLLEDKVLRDAKLPIESNAVFQTVNAGSIDGKNDFLLTISSPNKSILEVQEKAEEIAEELEKKDEVLSAEAIKQITKEKNPVTGAEFDFQNSFNRVGYEKEGSIVFEDAVAIGVVKKNGTGTFELSEAVKSSINEAKKNNKLDGYYVDYGGDFSRALSQTIKTLEGALTDGLIAIFVVLFLLISFRASIVAALFIPLNLGATLIALYLFGYDLNVIVLFALILLVALLVDDAIVVIEAIEREKRAGKKSLEAIKKALASVGIADISGTVTTILVFVPMAFISGVLGDFIIFIPITIIAGLIISIFIALTILAYISDIIIKVSDKKDKSIVLRKNIEEFVTEKISKLIFWYLAKWWRTALVIFLTFGIVGMGASYASKLKFSIFPTPKDSENITLQLNFEENVNLAQAREKSIVAEEIVRTEIGKELKGFSYFIANENQVFAQIKLTPTNERSITTNEISQKIKEKLVVLGSTGVLVGPEGAGPPTSEFQFFVQVYNENQATLESATSQIKTFLENKELSNNEKVVGVRVDNLKNISKNDKRRFVEVKVKISDPQNSGLIMELENKVKEEFNSEKLKNLGLETEDMAFDQGQETENVKSFQSAGVALLIAIAFIYLILVLQFNSFLQPALILFAIPFSFSGLFPGLYLTDNPLSFFVMIGIIAMAGVVTNNTILLTDYANQARERGEKISNAIVSAIKVRTRPLIATSLTSVAGLLPLALKDPFWESLAYTIIFGLIASTFTVILAYPAFYAVSEKVKEFKFKK